MNDLVAVKLDEPIKGERKIGSIVVPETVEEEIQGRGTVLATNSNSELKEGNKIFFDPLRTREMDDPDWGKFLMIREKDIYMVYDG